MKSFARHAICSLLLAVGASFVASCSDDDEIASAVDPKQWNLDQNMDTSVKPGDDFARYCWGTWYDNAGEATALGLGTIPESALLTQEKVATLNDNELQQIYADASRLGENEDEQAALRQRIAELNALLKNPEPAKVAKALGEFLAAGRKSFISCKVFGKAETSKYFLSKDTTCISDLAPSLPDKALMASWLVKLGLSEDEASDVAEKGLSAKNFNEQCTVTSDEKVMNAFCEALGTEDERITPWSDDFKIDGYIVTNAAALVRMMMCSEATDLVLVSRSALSDYETSLKQDEKTYLKAATDELVAYPRSKEYAEKYVTAETRQRVYEMMENIRSAFDQRLDQLTWMSSTTKKAAKEKLAAMKCFACYPDQWVSEGLPQLTGESLYEDMKILRQTRFNLKKVLYNSNPRETAFNIMLTTYYNTYTVNCCNDLETNTVHIFAPMTTSPFYSEENSDATLYAVGIILGHEITHGFDNNGAKRGAKGEDADWWTVSDKQDFEARSQLLIDCYNHLPAYMECPPYVYENGTKTLSENIADLGGLEAALQAYTTKLQKDGYRGDGLIKQQKRFFQAYANIWRSKYTLARNLKKLQSNNAHANEYTRVLGSTMNCDRWYEVYGVTWGDKYYLRPEKRTHIW